MEKCRDFRLRVSARKAIIVTLRAQPSRIEDLSEGYRYVLTARYQSDPRKGKLSRYRQMNGGNFLVSLREVCSSESILLLQGMVKESI